MEEYDGAIAHAHEEEEVDEEPHEPGEHAAKVHAGKADDGGAAPDGGHGAFVEIGEGGTGHGHAFV